MSFQAKQSCLACSGKAQPGTVVTMKYSLVMFAWAASLGIYNCRNVAGSTTKSQHACGRAGDIKIPLLANGQANTALGHLVVRFLILFSTQLGITEIIYDRVIYDAKTPGGRYYGGVHPHNDHVHFSQRQEKATSLTYVAIVAFAGPPQGDESAMRKGDKGRSVAEAQHVFKQSWGYDNGAFTPFVGNSLFTGKAFGPGEDGDYGGVTEANVLRFQKNFGLAETGVLDGVTHSMLFGKLGAGGGGVSSAVVDSKISAHAKLKASGSVHPHTHDEGETGQAQ